MPQLVDVLAEVLRSNGYRVAVDAESASGELPYEIPLWADKDERSYAVEFWLDSHAPTADFLESFARFVEETRADAGVLVNLGGALDAETVRSYAGRLDFWDADRVTLELGAAVLHETCPGVAPRHDPFHLRPKPAPPGPVAIVSETEAAPAAEPEFDMPMGFEELEAAEAPPRPQPFGSGEEPFELLPGRADEAAAEPEVAAPVAEPAVAPRAPDAGSGEGFELLPSRKRGEDARPDAVPEPAEAGRPEEVPARPRDMAGGRSRLDADVAVGTEFEMLTARAADPTGTAAAVPEPQGYEELPGRQEEPPTTESPAIPMSAEGRGYEELPGRHEQPAPQDSPGSLDATGRDGRDFEVFAAPKGSTEAGGPRPQARPGPSETFQVPPAFDEGAAPGPPGVLRMQVGRKVAHNLVKDKIRRVREERLRLVPFLVFEYQADVLVDGRLDAETKTGFVGVDAWMKRAQPWEQGFETAPLEPDGFEVERLKVRIDEDEARRVVLGHLEELVGREVVEEQDDDHWSVVVKRRVRLDEGDVKVRFVGLYWLPVWRLAGTEGSVEIDAAAGQILEEEILVEHSDSQLL